MSGKMVALWIVRILLAALFVYAGASKLTSQPQSLETFAKLGAPWLRWVVGAGEVAGGVGLLVSQTAPLAALCLALLMIGAMASHVLVLGVSTILPAIVAFALSVWVAYELRPGTSRA
jgi:uncharacterized membrane protein YphA (DoxX/SURF4 family)